MDAEQLQRIRLQAQDALDDLSPSGNLGWRAMTLCVRAVSLIESLDEANAAKVQPELRKIAIELARIESEIDGEPPCKALDCGDALDSALGRVSLMARVAAEALRKDAN